MGKKKEKEKLKKKAKKLAKQEAVLAAAVVARESTKEDGNENLIIQVDRPATSSKGSFDDTYKRRTIFIHNDLDRQIKKAIRGKRKGEKTAIINTALAEYFARHGD